MSSSLPFRQPFRSYSSDSNEHISASQVTDEESPASRDARSPMSLQSVQESCFPPFLKDTRMTVHTHGIPKLAKNDWHVMHTVVERVRSDDDIVCQRKRQIRVGHDFFFLSLSPPAAPTLNRFLCRESPIEGNSNSFRKHLRNSTWGARACHCGCWCRCTCPTGPQSAASTKSDLSLLLAFVCTSFLSKK